MLTFHRENWLFAHTAFEQKWASSLAALACCQDNGNEVVMVVAQIAV